MRTILQDRMIIQCNIVGKRSGFTCMGGAARCLMRDVYWSSAVDTVAGPPALGGIQILGGIPLFQELSVNVMLTVAVCWVDRWDWVFARCGLMDGIR